jgi:hypothetical protein
MPTYSTRPAVPEEALRLCEDIRNLTDAMNFLKRVDPYNCADDPEIGRKVLRYVQGKLKMAESHARRKLAVEFLDPRRIKIERNRTNRH